MSKKKPPRYMAEVKMHLDCGGFIVTYLPCKSEAHLEKKLRKGLKDGVANFDSFSVDDDAIMMATAKLVEVH